MNVDCASTLRNSDPVIDLQPVLARLRPRLHRYCARMTGSAVDGEDVVQETLAKAAAAYMPNAVGHLEGWLFRIAHNAALDFIKQRMRTDDAGAGDDLEDLADSEATADQRYAVAANLRTFMRLPALQRSAVILMDVLGYSLQEICELMQMNLPSIKSALHRGRSRLREIAQEPDNTVPASLPEPQRRLLAAYVERFNAHDFDAIRDMLADEVQLELVNKLRLAGRAAVSSYFGNYSSLSDWRAAAGAVDGRAAMLLYVDGHDESAPAGPAYFVLLEWREDRVIAIRDFRYARYVVESFE
ncbi:MAG: hypothetical protein JWR16_2848 [Nevskia sp.]|nr:hypothetical protein [Nevskia sp.]